MEWEFVPREIDTADQEAQRPGLARALASIRARGRRLGGVLLHPFRRMRLRVERRSGAVILLVGGTMDSRHSSLLKRAGQGIARAEVGRLIVNLQRARLGKPNHPADFLALVYNTFIKASGLPLRVVTDGGRIEHVLQVQIPVDASTGVFEFYDSEEGAVASLGPDHRGLDS